MKTAGLALVAGAAAIVISAGSAALASGMAGGAECAPKYVTVRGAPATVYCGRANARVTIGARTYRFTKGSCSTRKSILGDSAFEVATGRSVPDLTQKDTDPPHFFLNVRPAAAGSHRGHIIMWHGKIWFGVSEMMIVLKPNLRAGTFSGKGIQIREGVSKRVRATGSFTC